MKPVINFLYAIENKRLEEITENALEGIILNPLNSKEGSFDVLVRKSNSRKGVSCVIDIIPLECSLDSIVVKMDEGHFEKFNSPDSIDIRGDYDGVKTLTTIWGSKENYLKENSRARM